MKEHDNLAEIQTDKAAVEITSPVSGTIAKLGAEVGETIKVGEIFVSFKEVNKIEGAKTNTEPKSTLADKKTIIELAKEISQLADRARTNQLSPRELTGSTFTISNTGSTGGQFATPIINYPELAILGVHQIKKKPIIKENSVSIGYMMGMSITFDHRVIDGEPSGLFMNEISMFLKNPEKLLLHF